MAFKRALVVFGILSMFYSSVICETKEKGKEKTKIGKDVLDYTESDIYRLADQWDVSRLIIIIFNILFNRVELIVLMSV